VLPVAVAALAAGLFALPLLGLLWRAPWSIAWRELTSTDALAALRLSLFTSLSATAIALVLGVPLAWVQARVDYHGRTVVRALLRPPGSAGAVLCWARARGRFGATIPFAGNLPRATQTLPLFVYVKLEGPTPGAAIVSSLLLLAVSVAVLVGLRERWLRAI